ncbi:hypothetical protein SEA_BIPAUNETO_64 [Gordonia phage BiPauneto]|nr:hypothetical protein SEA_BIPAUNETO_64 [Gordonia phage BiPauneto]
MTSTRKVGGESSANFRAKSWRATWHNTNEPAESER